MLAMEGNGQNAESGEAEAEEGRRSGRELLEGIRENQRRRMSGREEVGGGKVERNPNKSGKSRGQFHMASAILAALIGTFDVGEGGAASVQVEKCRIRRLNPTCDLSEDKSRTKR